MPYVTLIFLCAQFRRQAGRVPAPGAGLRSVCAVRREEEPRCRRSVGPRGKEKQTLDRKAQAAVQYGPKGCTIA